MAKNQPKVVILCGGKGTRLKEETEFRPKHLVSIGGVPILLHIMKTYAHYGFKEFVLCLGYKKEMIKNYFLNFAEMNNDFSIDFSKKNNKGITYYGKETLRNWRITFVDTGEEVQTGARIYKVRDYIGKDSDFLLTYGDGVADINIKDLFYYHKKANKIGTVTGVHSASVFGLIEHSNGIVKTFREKPKIEDVISGGFFAFKSQIFDYIDPDDSCVFEDKPLKKLAKEGELSLYKHDGFWYCMDTQKHVNFLNDLCDSGRAPWQVWK